MQHGSALTFQIDSPSGRGAEAEASGRRQDRHHPVMAIWIPEFRFFNGKKAPRRLSLSRAPTTIKTNALLLFRRLQVFGENAQGTPGFRARPSLYDQGPQIAAPSPDMEDSPPMIAVSGSSTWRLGTPPWQKAIWALPLCGSARSAFGRSGARPYNSNGLWPFSPRKFLLRTRPRLPAK